MPKITEKRSLENRLHSFRRALALRVRREGELRRARPSLPPEETDKAVLFALQAVQLDFLSHFPEFRRGPAQDDKKTPASP